MAGLQSRLPLNSLNWSVSDTPQGILGQSEACHRTLLLQIHVLLLVEGQVDVLVASQCGLKLRHFQCVSISMETRHRRYD